jgi:predicted peptidase
MKKYFNNIKRIILSGVIVCAMNMGLVAQSVNPLAPDYQKFPKKEWEENFDAFQFKVYEKDKYTLPYRIYTPEPREHGKKYPFFRFGSSIVPLIKRSLLTVRAICWPQLSRQVASQL